MLKAEARATLMAIQLCESLGLFKIHLEGDSQGVIATINSRDPDWSSMSVLVEDIKHELQSLQQWHLSFVCLEGNQVAHNLANLATRTFMNNMWLNELPECIAKIVQSEQVSPSDLRLN